MKTTYKYQFSFTESNRRLDMVRARTKTLELPKELFEHYDVDGMEKAFFAQVSKFAFSDSNVYLKSVKVGRTTFKLL